MKHRIRKLTSLLLSLSLISALTLPAAASNALGEDLSAKDTLLHQETQLSTNVFWSTTYSDLRTENLITYTPNKAVTPIVTYGDALTDRSSVADMAALLEEDGYRVVAGINGDFYNVSTGLPIGMVVTEGLLRSSDAGYYAIGFRADGSAILGKPGVKVSANLGYAVDDGFGNSTELVRPVAAVNKARTNSGLYLYTYDFNAKHTTGTTEPGINVVCTVEQGKLAIGSTVTLRVNRVEETAVTSLAPDQIVLSANLQADSYYTTALQNIPQGSELTLTVSANDGWEDVEYAIGALYCLAENGAVVPNLAAGSNPRTAVGQKVDGTLVFYTIDGRKTGHSIGASLTQVGERLLELGCQTVLCLDGGGSTNLAVTTPDSTTATIINRPSETGRKVTNQVFLVASDRSSGRLDHFYVNAAGDYVLAGSAVFMLQSAFQSFFSVAEKPKLGLLLSLAAGATNITFDYVFIALLGMGVTGAAWATVLGYCVGGVIPVVYFLLPRREGLRLVRTNFYGRELLHACINGSSELMSNISSSLVGILYNLELMRLVGERGVAAHSVMMYVDFVFIAAFLGFSIGSAPIISYHFGAENHDELKNVFRRSMFLILVTSGAMVVLSEALCRPLCAAFVGYSPDLMQLTVHGFRLFALCYLFCGVNIYASAFFTALCNGALSAFISFLRSLLLRGGLVLLLPPVLGLDGVWLAVVAAEGLSAAVSAALLWRQRKRYHYL